MLHAPPLAFKPYALLCPNRTSAAAAEASRALRTKRDNRITPAMAAEIAKRPATLKAMVALIDEAGAQGAVRQGVQESGSRRPPKSAQGFV